MIQKRYLVSIRSQNPLNLSVPFENQKDATQFMAGFNRLSRWNDDEQGHFTDEGGSPDDYEYRGALFCQKVMDYVVRFGGVKKNIIAEVQIQ